MKQNGPDTHFEQHGTTERFPPVEPNAQPNPLDHLRLDLARYDTQKIRAREWGVPGRFPLRNAALLSGHGGAGKSITMQQLGVAHVLAKDWLGSWPKQGPVVLINCEDEGNELVSRLQPILHHYGARFADVAENLHIFPLVEMSDDDTGPLLATVQNGLVKPTPLYAALLATVTKVQPIYIALDNVADLFGGDEINRVQVRQFVALIRRLAMAANGYALLSAHPSLSGIQSKSGLSGSTQWHNSVRARAYLRGPDDKDKNGDASNADTRVLEFMKSNYSALAEQVTLKWENGLYLPVSSPVIEDAATQVEIEKLFLDLLDRHVSEGANVSGNEAARNYAPRVFAKSRDAKQAKVSERGLASAMSRLIKMDQVRAEPYGAPSAGTKRLILKAATP